MYSQSLRESKGVGKVASVNNLKDYGAVRDQGAVDETCYR